MRHTCEVLVPELLNTVVQLRFSSKKTWCVHSSVTEVTLGFGGRSSYDVKRATKNSLVALQWVIKANDLSAYVSTENYRSHAGLSARGHILNEISANPSTRNYLAHSKLLDLIYRFSANACSCIRIGVKVIFLPKRFTKHKVKAVMYQSMSLSEHIRNERTAETTSSNDARSASQALSIRQT